MTYDDERHVSLDERNEALDPNVGDGTAETAPERAADDWAELAGASWRPTRKWVAAAGTGLLSIAATAVSTGDWDAVETGQVITLASGLLVAYLFPNAK